MKRDIKLNMVNLRLIRNKIYNYIDELRRIENASIRFLEVIKNQDSQAYDRLSGLWEENVTQNESDLKEKLEIIYEILNNYIADMESYIAPKDPYAIMRVDRNDIWWNYEQIAGIPGNERTKEVLWDTGSSWVDYHKWFVYNPWEDEATNNARKAYLQDEENAERTRRESNYTLLANFRSTMMATILGSIHDSTMAIKSVYDNNIVPFENTDDDYKKKLDEYYDIWATAGDQFYDGWNVVVDVLRGALDAVIDFLVGTVGLLVGLIELAIYQEMQRFFLDQLGLIPEWLEEDVNGIREGVIYLFTDPGNALEAMGQGMFDTADENGLAYSISYVIVDLIAIDKALGQLGALGKVDDVADVAGDMARHSDDVLEAASTAARHTDDIGEAASTVARNADEVAIAAKIAADDLNDMARSVGRGNGPLKSFADLMTPEEAERYLRYLEQGSTEGLSLAELLGIKKVDDLLALEKVDYQDILDLRNANSALEGGSNVIDDVVQSTLEGGADVTKPYATSRPSYGNGQVEQVWENAKDPVTGKVYDPSGVEITWDPTKPRNGQWDMGHIPGEKYSEMHQLYMDDVISKEEFLDWYRNPDNYRPELPNTNRSHKYE